jgi:hypothetical protein
VIRLGKCWNHDRVGWIHDMHKCMIELAKCWSHVGAHPRRCLCFGPRSHGNRGSKGDLSLRRQIEAIAGRIVMREKAPPSGILALVLGVLRLGPRAPLAREPSSSVRLFLWARSTSGRPRGLSASEFATEGR